MDRFQVSPSSILVAPIYGSIIGVSIAHVLENFIGILFAHVLKSFIGEYTGVVRVPWTSEDQGNAYLFSTPGPLLVDAKSEGKETRFINHSITSPNLAIFYLFQGGNWRIFFVANQEIAVDQQLLFDYGPNYWNNRNAPSEL